MAKLPVGSSSHSPVGYDAFKITLGQHLDVLTPHQVQSVLEVKGHHWLTGGRLSRYQALLMDTPDIKVVPHPEPRNSASRSLEWRLIASVQRPQSKLTPAGLIF